MSGRAIEAAGDVDVLFTRQNRNHNIGKSTSKRFLPVHGVSEEQLADAAQLSSLADETAEGRSIVILAKERFNLREREFQQSEVKFIDFSAKTRMSGIDYRGDVIRKGAADTMKNMYNLKERTIHLNVTRLLIKSLEQVEHL